jgi:hypothetical protein
VSALEITVTTAAVIGALLVIIGALVKVYKLAHRIDAAIGVDQNGRTIAERIGRIEYQVYANSGTSLFDRVTQTEKAVGELTGQVEVVREMLTELVERR